MTEVDRYRGRHRPADRSRLRLRHNAFTRISVAVSRPRPDERSRRGLGHAALAGLSVGVVLVGTAALATTLPRELDITSMPPELPGDADVLAGDPGPDPQRRVSPPSRGESPTRERAGEPPAESPEPSPSPSPIPAPSPPAGGPGPDSYEAEAADLGDAARVVEMDDASGGEVVELAGQEDESEVRFTEVTVEEAGVYQLTLYYLSAPEAQGLVAVNEAPPETVAFPSTGAANAVGSVSLPVELAAGENVISFGIPEEPAPALDRITVDQPAAA
jgi:hypothetical protein